MKNVMESIEGYKILTNRKVYDEHYMSEEEDWSEKLAEEQSEILAKRGIDFASTICGIHFIKSFWGDGNFVIKDTADEAIQYLSIKDGVDLVEFPNGNIGFVAYYNNHLDAFEIVHVFK